MSGWKFWRQRITMDLAPPSRMKDCRSSGTRQPRAGTGFAPTSSRRAGQEEGHMLPWAVRELSAGEVVDSTRYHDIAVSIDRVERSVQSCSCWATRSRRWTARPSG